MALCKWNLYRVICNVHIIIFLPYADPLCVFIWNTNTHDPLQKLPRRTNRVCKLFNHNFSNISEENFVCGNLKPNRKHKNRNFSFSTHIYIYTINIKRIRKPLRMLLTKGNSWTFLFFFFFLPFSTFCFLLFQCCVVQKFYHISDSQKVSHSHASNTIRLELRYVYTV